VPSVDISSRIIFGPVHSRRFGKSLGIDLSPTKKQCNFDCLYCELPSAKTAAFYDDVVSVEMVMKALHKALAEHQAIDVITITANGEPTLYPYLGELIREIDTIKGATKTLILSNGSTIGDPKVQDALLGIDMVKLSLDCATQECLKKLDRAHSGISIQKIKEGMLSFRARYKGVLIIEILFVKTFNDKSIEIAALNEFLCTLRPDRVDISTIDRPPAYKVKPISYEELEMILDRFDSTLPIHIASRKKAASSPEHYNEAEILRTLSKRPFSDEDIEVLFDLESRQRLQNMILQGKISIKETNGIKFYGVSQNKP